MCYIVQLYIPHILILYIDWPINLDAIHSLMIDMR